MTLKLWVDTNEASTKKLRILSRLARNKNVQVAIHPQTYLEGRRQMRALKGPDFDEAVFDSLLTDLEIAVPHFVLDQATAAAWADTLHERYSTDESWEAAKQRTLGGQLRAAFAVLPGSMPMTTDWLIALTVEREPSWHVLTNDDGEEWCRLRGAVPCRALRWDEALAWLAALPDAPAGGPEGTAS